MKTITYDLLKLLNDDDIKLIIDETQLDIMLVPFKQNSKIYAKYMGRLGRMDSKSNLVKKTLPRIVYELYDKGDMNMMKLLSNQALMFKNMLVDILKQYESDDLKPVSFASLDSLESIEILSKIDSQININLFFLQLKLNSVNISDSKKEEINILWEERKKKIEAEKKQKDEIESAKREIENVYKNEIRNLKKEYDNKFVIADKEKKTFEDKIEKLMITIDNLSNELNIQKTVNSKNEKSIKNYLENIKLLECKQEEKKKKIIEIEKAFSELKENIKRKSDEFKFEWKKEVDRENKNLIILKEQLILEKESIQSQIDILLANKGQAEDTLKGINEEISATTEQIGILKNDINIYHNDKNNRLEDIPNTHNIFPVSGLRLYVEQGSKDIHKEICEKYSEYAMAVENNIDIVDCKWYSGKIEDFFNAAIHTGLVPTLCGFGARKVAMALVAARYGEIPTIISIPSGYSDIESLNKEISSSETDVVIIEDLFGRMNEEIILPILRGDIDKQLVFCVESYDCFKHIDLYFMNYIQLIKVDVTSHKKMSGLMFTDARELFANNKDYCKSNILYRNVKKILKEIIISDTYAQSRGEMLTYLNEVMEHGADGLFEDWFKHELIHILNPEQKNIIKERLSKDSFGFSDEFIESLGQC